jgi:recombination protein RecA
MYNQGISVEGSVLDVATDLGIVRKSGAWFYLDEERLGQGRENTKEFLRHNPDVLEDMRERIKAGSPELSGRLAFDGGESEDSLATADAPLLESVSLLGEERG